MSSGVGRGRGWLNLKIQSAQNSPGSEGTFSNSTKYNSLENKNYSDVQNDYSSLINKIKQLSVNDDGIKFNQKIKYVIEGWSTDCSTSVDVEKSFQTILKACLGDADLATKLVLLIASRTFLSQEIHEQNIRLMFLRKLQDNFESSVQLQLSNPNAFRNSVQMMGEFFNKARLANGEQFTFMATPLISYLEMLLESAQISDLRLFAMQLHLNGSALKAECPEKIADILGKIRLMLCSEKTFSKECKLWLLLALEVTSNRLALLPADIHKFYQEQLGDQAMAYFQGTHGTLTIQTTQTSKTLDSYQSAVNVLQVSSPSESTVDPVSPHNTASEVGSLTNYNTSGFHSDTSQTSNNSKSDNSNKGNKTGRPILGAGARLNVNRNQNETSSGDIWDQKKNQNDTNSSNWNQNRNQSDSEQHKSNNWYKNKPQNDKDKTNSDGNWRDRDNKKGNQGNQRKQGGGDWDKKKTPPKTSTKGWEHDDRFDTDYS